MTRKDYETVAGAFFVERTILENTFRQKVSRDVKRQVNYIIDRLADRFASENAKFDRNKFKEAAGYYLI